MLLPRVHRGVESLPDPVTFPPHEEMLFSNMIEALRQEEREGIVGPAVPAHGRKGTHVFSPELWIIADSLVAASDYGRKAVANDESAGYHGYDPTYPPVEDKYTPPSNYLL